MNMVTISEAVNITGLSRAKIYRMSKEGKIASVRKRVNGASVFMVDPDEVLKAASSAEVEIPNDQGAKPEQPEQRPAEHPEEQDGGDLCEECNARQASNSCLCSKCRTQTEEANIKSEAEAEAVKRDNTLGELMKILDSASFVLLREKLAIIEQKESEVSSLNEKIRQLQFVDDIDLISKLMSRAERIATELERGCASLLPIVENVIKMIASTSMGIAKFISKGERYVSTASKDARKHWRRGSR